MFYTVGGRGCISCANTKLGCTKITDVHPSIAFLVKLKYLNLRNCKRLESLPTKIEMKFLETMILSGCTYLQRFPEIDGNMKCLQKLYLDGTGIEELPSSVGHLGSLEVLNLSDCSKLENLSTSLIRRKYRMGRGVLSSSLNLMLFKQSLNPMALTLPRLSGLSSLTELNISGRNLLQGPLPSDICCLPSLETLILSDNNFVSLPANLCQLTKIHRLELRFARSLKHCLSFSAGLR
ncbi:Leucine-rich repeat - like 10, partial [Theobroma cacao]